MADAGFRLPGASYEDLVNIIVAYGTRDEASNPGDVGKLDSVHRASATRTNGFLVEIGVLKGEREKLVTKRGRELALALERRDESGARGIWRQVVSTSEFLQNVVSAVKFREGMPYETVQAYIAHSASQPRNKPVMTGSSTVIEILKSAHLLKEDDTGNISVAHEGVILEPSVPDEDPDEALSAGFPDHDERLTVSAGVDDLVPEDSFTTDVEPASTGTVVNIHLHVRCEASELDEIAPKLKALVRNLKDAGDETSGPPTSSPRDFANAFAARPDSP